jgi:hypothetical protein
MLQVISVLTLTKLLSRVRLKYYSRFATRVCRPVPSLRGASARTTQLDASLRERYFGDAEFYCSCFYLSVSFSATRIRIREWTETWVSGRAIAQAVSRWLPTAAARVWSSDICGGQFGAGVGFLRVLRFLLPVFIPPNSPSSWSPGVGTIGHSVADVPSGPSLDSTPHYANKKKLSQFKAVYIIGNDSIKLILILSWFPLLDPLEHRISKIIVWQDFEWISYFFFRTMLKYMSLLPYRRETNVIITENISNMNMNSVYYLFLAYEVSG